MTDRELLELAAKAADIDAEWHYDAEAAFEAAHDGMFLKGKRSPENSKYWNPLNVDGDALRLAVKLGISISQEVDRGEVYCDVFATSPTIGSDEPYKQDPYAATRRAIVRAAAAIGQSMEGKK